MSEKETVTGEIGLESHVRVETSGRERVSGLSPDNINGLTGVVVRMRYGSGFDTERDDLVIRLDNQDGDIGWDSPRHGDPDNPEARCLHLPARVLVLVGDVPEPEPNPEADAILEFKKGIYAKAIDLVRTDYPGYGRQVQEWMAEVNMAPSAATYRISGDLKYRSSRYGGIPSMEGILGDRLSSLPEAKIEVVDMTFPAPKPGETVETLTADIFALVERKIASNVVCADARVFIRKLGLRSPPRKSAKVELDLKLNAAELAALSRDGVAGLLALVRDRDAAAKRVTGVRVIEDKPATKRAPRKTTKAAAPSARAKPAIEEPEDAERRELLEAL